PGGITATFSEGGGDRRSGAGRGSERRGGAERRDCDAEEPGGSLLLHIEHDAGSAAVLPESGGAAGDPGEGRSRQRGVAGGSFGDSDGHRERAGGDEPRAGSETLRCARPRTGEGSGGPAGRYGRADVQLRVASGDGGPRGSAEPGGGVAIRDQGSRTEQQQRSAMPACAFAGVFGVGGLPARGGGGGKGADIVRAGGGGGGGAGAKEWGGGGECVGGVSEGVGEAGAIAGKGCALDVPAGHGESECS